MLLQRRVLAIEVSASEMSRIDLPGESSVLYRPRRQARAALAMQDTTEVI
jgi:hypothetical protein